MTAALDRNLFFVREHVGMFKAANNYDILDPDTGEEILHCRDAGAYRPAFVRALACATCRAMRSTVSASFGKGGSTSACRASMSAQRASGPRPPTNLWAFRTTPASATASTCATAVNSTIGSWKLHPTDKAARAKIPVTHSARNPRLDDFRPRHTRNLRLGDVRIIFATHTQRPAWNMGRLWSFESRLPSDALSRSFRMASTALG